MMETQSQRYFMTQNAVMTGQTGGDQCAHSLKTCTVNGQSFLAHLFPETERSSETDWSMHRKMTNDSENGLSQKDSHRSLAKTFNKIIHH
jgi:hypothetical protein